MEEQVWLMLGVEIQGQCYLNISHSHVVGVKCPPIIPGLHHTALAYRPCVAILRLLLVS